MEKYARAHVGRKGENMSFENSNNTRNTDAIPSYACMAVIIPLLSLVLPLSLSGSVAVTAIAWVACAISAAILILLVKSFGAIAICALALTFFLSSLGTPIPVSITLGAVLVSGLYSAAVAAAQKRHIPFVICAPLLSAALAYAMTRSIPLTLLSLIAIPPALAMGLSTRRKLDRSRAITIFTVVAAIELLCAVTGYILWENGTINRDIIENVIQNTRVYIESALQMAIKQAGNVEIDETLIMEIRFMSAYAINLLPGFCAVALLSLGFFAHKTECSLFGRYEKYSLLEASETSVTVSCTAAIVFLVAHIFSFTSGASHAPSFVAIAAENVSLILIPALLLIGWEKVAALPKKIGFLAIAVWIGIVLASSALSASLISILALIGAFCIIFARTDSWAKDHYRKGEDQ